MEVIDSVPPDDTLQSDLEIETLCSIYVRELDVKTDENGTTVSIQLHPATADKLEEQFVRLTLIFNLSKEYPKLGPEIFIQNTRGLSDEKIEVIIKNLEDEAEERKGSPMLFELIELAKEHLTADNKPNEECTICLYGFMEGDLFMKTECYHYFHSHCLSRYIKSKLSSEEDNTSVNGQANTELNSPKKIPCPVCRLEICFSEYGQSFPEPVAVLEAPSTIDIEPWSELKEFDELYKKQLAQGGIIDLKAEDEKFLLEISSVPDEVLALVKLVEQNDITESEVIKKKGFSPDKAKYQAPSNSKTSPKFRYLKSRTKPKEHSEATALKGSCSKINGDLTFQQNAVSTDRRNKHNPDTLLKNLKPEESSSKYEKLSISNEDNKEIENQSERDTSLQKVHNISSRNGASYNSNRQSTQNSKPEFNRNNNTGNRYNSRRPYTNHYQEAQTNFFPQPRNYNYKKFNTTRDSTFNSSYNTVQNGRNRMHDFNTFNNDESSRPYKSYQSDYNSNKFNYSKPEYNSSFQNSKFQNRKENYSNPRVEAKYRNNFRERSNYNNSSHSYSQNERQKYYSSDSPKIHKQYQQPKHFPNRYQKPNDHTLNHRQRRPYINESKNEESEGESKNIKENYQNSSYLVKNNERQQIEDKECSNKSYNEHQSYSNSEVTLSLKPETDKTFIKSNSHYSEKSRLENRKKDNFEKASSTNLSPKPDKEILSNNFDNSFTKVTSSKGNICLVDDLSSPSISLSTSICVAPLLPPGFANPSKKVIYGLPSFHASPPPGFQFS